MVNKINIIDIIKKHFASLVDANDNKPGLDDFFTFLFVPLSVTTIFYIFKLTITDDAIDTIVSSLSIFVGLLFNAMIVLIDPAKNSNGKAKELINEIIANISFSVIIALISIILLFIIQIDALIPYLKKVFMCLSILLISEFIIVFLMVIKRVYIVFTKQ